MAPAPPEQMQFKPRDAIGSSLKSTMLTGMAGLFVSGVQNTLTRQNIGAMGIFTRTGTTAAVFGEGPSSQRQVSWTG